MNNLKSLLTMVGVSVLLLVGGVWLVMRNQPVQVKSAESAVLGVNEQAYDWGTIQMNDGEVEHTFTIENQGSGELQLANLETSCMCTKAQVIIGKDVSPWFGMHTQRQWVGKVQPGETAQVKIVFDPAYHGPGGVGAITRTVSLQTSDPNHTHLEFRLTANVTSQ